MSKPSAFTDEACVEFAEIARRKGMRVLFPGTIKRGAALETEDQLLIDMDLVEASLRSAIRSATSEGKIVLRSKFERLLEEGTDAQRLDFVLRPGPYMFPEDLERMARQSRAGETRRSGHWVEEFVVTVVSKCVAYVAQKCSELVIEHVLKPVIHWVEDALDTSEPPADEGEYHGPGSDEGHWV